MIHTEPGSMETIKRLDTRGIHGTRAYVKPVKDGSRSFVMILVEYPEDQTAGLIDGLTYRG